MFMNADYRCTIDILYMLQAYFSWGGDMRCVEAASLVRTYAVHAWVGYSDCASSRVDNSCIAPRA